MLVDSTAFIDYLRGKKKAKNFLENPPELLSTSVIVVMEIIAGFKKKSETEEFLLFLQELNIEIIHLSFAVSQKAFELFKNWHHRGLGIADSLIAATVLEKNQKIVTSNVKHFSFVKELIVIMPYK